MPGGQVHESADLVKLLSTVGADKALAGAKLKASHVLDGSIQRAGGRIRVTAHLLDCATQSSLWSQRFDRDLEDIFAVQDEIAEAIAAALELEFAEIGRAHV